MSSIYSRSPEDDFFYALNKSLRNEYSSQKMTSFINDLLVAINNLDDDPDEGFGFYDEDTDCSTGIDCFASPSTIDYSGSHQQNFRENKFKKNESHNSSVDMFADDQPQIWLSKINVASNGEENTTIVDMFDDEPLHKTEARAPAMIVKCNEEEAPQSLPVADMALVLEVESRDGSIDMFVEFENDADVMDTSVSSVEINTSEDYQNEEPEDTDRVTQMNWSIGQQHGVGSFKNKSSIINETVQSTDTDFTNSLHHQDLLSNENRGTEVITKQKLSQKKIEFLVGVTDEHVENEASHSVDILLGVPINISHYETDGNENTLSTELKPSQMPNRMVQQCLTVVTNFPEIFSTKENLSQDVERRILHSVDERPDTSVRSSSQSSSFLGFSPVAPLFQQPIRDPTKHDSDAKTTLCEEYEFSNNFVPISRRSSSGSPIFLGFSDALMNQKSEHHNSIRSASCSEGGPNSTFCEEYETERLFAVYLNATQSDPISLEEAYTQCFSESQNQESGVVDRRQSFIEDIEKLVLKIQKDLANGSKLAIAVPYRKSWKNCFVNDERLLSRPLSDGANRIVGSKRRIAMIVYVLSFVYQLLINNETCTRREIYYSDPEFAHSQIQVDTAIMDICFVLNAPPWEIGILSSSKGLIAGPIKLTLKDDTVLDVEGVDGGILLPQQTMSIKKVETAAKFVLLVEKHTVYEKLLLENVLSRLGPCILITGKGYPDINTRAILKKIWDDCKCPIYALVDADPHGIDIMLSYRHGSHNMSFFNDDLAIPSIRWLGVFPSEIRKFNLQTMPMTQRDANRLDSLMRRPYLSKKIYAELLVLKKTLKKSEVEALLSSAVVDCVNSLLLQKIQSGGFI